MFMQVTYYVECMEGIRPNNAANYRTIIKEREQTGRLPAVIHLHLKNMHYLLYIRPVIRRYTYFMQVAYVTYIRYNTGIVGMCQLLRGGPHRKQRTEVGATMRDKRQPKRLTLALQADLVPWASYAAGLHDESVTAYINRVIAEARDNASDEVAEGYQSFLRARGEL